MIASALSTPKPGSYGGITPKDHSSDKVNMPETNIDEALFADLLAQDPDRFLAASHCSRPARAGVAALFALDLAFGHVLVTTREPMLGEMRFAWWRETLEKLGRAEPPAEPVLAALSTHVLPAGIGGEELAVMEDGWLVLLDDRLDRAALMRHARRRGGVLFELIARRLGVVDINDDLRTAGEGWAFADLSRRLGEPTISALAREEARARLKGWRIPANAGRARPLLALAALARHDVTNSSRYRPGSPARQLRYLWHRMLAG